MASLVQIRDVPDEERRALKARAAARGQSLNAYLLGILSREVARPTVAEVVARARRRTEQADISAVHVMREARLERDEALQHNSEP